jgi:fluoroacetyl-CoA thioesterase
MTEIEIGSMGEVKIVVAPEQSAQAVGSGDLPVFSTPSMLALMEHAAMLAIARYMDETTSSVGILVDIEHLSATPIGEEVRARAEVTDVEGKRVTFFVQAWDDQELIGEGSHVRYIIDRERFMQRVRDNSE